MEGMYKSAPVATPVVVKHDSKTESIGANAPTIHPEIYSFLGADPVMSDKTQIKTISDWAMKDSTAGLALNKIKNLEIKLGFPSVHENRVTKLYNYIRMTDKITSKEAEMKDSIDSISAKHRATMKQLVDNHTDKIDKINAELEKARKEYMKAKNSYKRTASERASSVRSQYASQLKELKAMRDAYKGGK